MTFFPLITKIAYRAIDADDGVPGADDDDWHVSLLKTRLKFAVWLEKPEKRYEKVKSALESWEDYCKNKAIHEAEDAKKGQDIIDQIKDGYHKEMANYIPSLKPQLEDKGNNDLIDQIPIAVHAECDRWLGFSRY